MGSLAKRLFMKQNVEDKNYSKRNRKKISKSMAAKIPFLPKRASAQPVTILSTDNRPKTTGECEMF